MKNNSLSYNLEDLDIFTPELKGWKLHFFTVSSIVVAITSLVAQITVYRSLKRLGSRHINLMIFPSQVSEDPSKWRIFSQPGKIGTVKNTKSSFLIPGLKYTLRTRVASLEQLSIAEFSGE